MLDLLAQKGAGAGHSREALEAELNDAYFYLNDEGMVIYYQPDTLAPYAAGLLEPAIARLTAFDILNPHGIIVAEHPADRALPPVEPPYRVRRTYRYGKIGLTLICRSGDQENEE